MNIHLITIKVSVKRSAYTFIESKSFSFRNLNFKSHHADSMQTRLSIEYDDISISEMSFDYIANS